MVLVGLTGGIATGKSTVSTMLRDHGVPVIDADAVARRVVEPGQPAYLKLRSEFGDEFFDDENGGAMIREKMGKLIFNDPEKRKRLNAITHPAIRWEMFLQFLYYLVTGSGHVVLDTPLLFEVGYDRFLFTRIVVWCDGDKELARLISRDKLSEEDALSRINAQMPIEEKKRRATVLLDNNGSIEELKTQVETVVREMNRSWVPLAVRAGIAGVLVVLATSFLKLIRVL